jgi:hypothetical protein
VGAEITEETAYASKITCPTLDEFLEFPFSSPFHGWEDHPNGRKRDFK